MNYRHVIDSLIRKPGAFAQYAYRDDLFPTTRFRLAYDQFCNGGDERTGALTASDEESTKYRELGCGAYRA